MPKLIVMLAILSLSATALSASSVPRGCVLYVDPATDDVFDQRVRLTREACAAHGVSVIPVWSAGFARVLCAKEDTTPEEEEEIRSAIAPCHSEGEWAAQRGIPPVLGVVCGTDAGLDTSERLLHALGPPERSNGILRARRDKFEMHEAIRASGLDAAKQAVATDWHEAAAFLDELPAPLSVVVKPRRGQASVRVGLARTADEARALFERVLELPVTLDEDADVSSVLLQENLQGEEWVVDTISREGEHKVMAIWRYEKGEANGAPFVYFGIEPVGTGSARAQQVAVYATKVLDALRWRWGPVHMEVMWVESPRADGSGEERGPVLVEANCGRLNGEEFKLLAEVMYGGAQLAVLLGDDDAWAALPSAPAAELGCAGRLVKLVSCVSGTLLRLNHAEAIDELESVVRVKLAANEAGELIKRTVDLNTCAGDVVMLHTDPEVVEADVAAVRALQHTLFEVEAEADDGADGGAGGAIGIAPATRLQFEADEAMRLARLVLGELEGGEADLRTLTARFPLIEEPYEVRVHPRSAAASGCGADPRKLGEMLLRAVRTARDEEEARANCEALVWPA